MTPPPVVHASWAMMILAALLLLPPLAFILLARRGRDLYIRRIPGIDAIEEALGRATELGKPVVFSTGLTGLDSLLFAILGIISHIGRRCATFGCRLVVPQCDYEVMPVVSETVRESFRAAGRIDAFNPQDIRFLSTEQFAFASGYMGIVHREQAASCFLFGSFAAESLVLAEAGQQIGAMQVAGTTSYNQIPFFLTSCDYTLIGEEVYAAGAYLSRDPVQLGSIRGQDFAKMVVLAAIIIGVMAATWASARQRDPREGTKYNSGFARLLYKQPQQQAAVAQFEIRNSFSPAPAPTAEEFDAGVADGRPLAWLPQTEEAALQQRRQNARRKAKAIAADLDRKARRLANRVSDWRPRIQALADPAIRSAAEEIAAALGKYATKAGEEAASLRKCATNLADIERSISAAQRQRAAQMAEVEIAALAAWVEEVKGEADLAAAVSAARNALASGTDAADIGRALQAARRACYERWWQMAREYMDRCAAAEKKEPPTFIGDVSGAGLALVMDASAAVSGRLLPLSYKWNVTPALGDEENTSFVGVQAMLPVKRPGHYRVALKISEIPDSPRNVILSQVTNDPTDVRHETIAAGGEIKISWRPPRDLVPKSAHFKWDMGDGETKGEGDDFTVSHSYQKAGTYLLSVAVSYKRRMALASDSSIHQGRKTAGRAAADLEVLRRDLASSLAETSEYLADLEERLSEVKAMAEAYGERLVRHGRLADEAWPDRDCLAALSRQIDALRAWTSEANRECGRRLTQAQSLGEEPTAGADEVKDSGEDRFREEKCWNRFRIYWHVVEPLSHERAIEFDVAQADVILPRPPWQSATAAPEGSGR